MNEIEYGWIIATNRKSISREKRCAASISITLSLQISKLMDPHGDTGCPPPLKRQLVPCSLHLVGTPQSNINQPARDFINPGLNDRHYRLASSWHPSVASFLPLSYRRMISRNDSWCPVVTNLQTPCAPIAKDHKLETSVKKVYTVFLKGKQHNG